MTTTAVGLRVMHWSRSPLESARPELLVHALAQLPDTVAFEMTAQESAAGRLRLLADAYRVSERLDIVTGSTVRRGSVLHSEIRASTMAELVEALYDDDDPPAATRQEDDVFESHRVALVTNLRAPYRIPLFNLMAKRLGAADAAFQVFFASDDAPGRPWMRPADDVEFDHEGMRSVALPVRKRALALPLDLERRLDAFRPTLVVSGGFSPLVSGRAASVARGRRIPFGLWVGEHSSMPTARSRWRRLQRRRLVSRADFAIVYGFAAGEYMHQLRPDLPVTYGRNTSKSNTAYEARARADTPLEILAVGDLASPRKGIDVLLEALSVVPDLDCRLTVVGGGTLLPRLREQASRDARVHLLGPLPSEEVRGRFATADVFVFPSRADVFGLALAEAMGSGVASLTSAAPGAVQDLCVDGRNAVVVHGHDPQAWAEALEVVAQDPESSRTLGASAARTIQNRWTIDHAADAMLAGLRLGLLSRKRPT